MSTYLASLQSAIRDLLAADERVCVLGEDILDPYGGAFKVTQGASTTAPDRVMTTPISEAAIVGVGVGMALRGLRPIVEIMFGDFVTLGADQLINYASKLPPMFNGKAAVPLVVRTPMGGRRGYGPTHSQSLEKLFFGVPHLSILAPSQYHDPGALLTAAVQHDGEVTLFIEHKLLYPARLHTQSGDGIYVTNAPGTDPRFPTKIVRNYVQGTPDVAIIGYGGASLIVHPLLAQLADEEIRVAAVFPAQVQPLPAADLIAAAREAKRVIVVEEGTRAFGWGAEVAATLNHALWGQLEAPVARVAALDTIIPATRPLEDLVLPSTRDVEQAVYEVLA
ncbi:MAG: alpha-ketoacid dehydrogenase subunit beta [Anaerolinea sp.]|nr:alpha-ketoacid dehydrogenase subunit beta [Anaerolinea sp.]